MGLPSERVLVIDEDQGHSGSSAADRRGFQRLLAEVSLDHVGLVLGIEMSRLARCCKDWHQLLELCAVFGALLADQDGLYDPREYNDRLLLGLKGTLSEAELHILRQRMGVQYDRSAAAQAANASRPRYACSRHASEYGDRLCQSLTGGALDAFVAGQILAVLEPAALELSLSAAEDLRRQRATVEQHWRQRLERAAYQANRAARQYHAVEPENRLVARELERRWEQALGEHRQLQEQCDRFRAEQPPTLSDQERHAIRRLSADIPSLWRSPQTSSRDRQRIVRNLIQQVTVTVPADNSQRTDLTIHWAGGLTSQLALTRPVARYDQLDNYEQLLARILELRRQSKTAAQIAQRLNHEGLRARHTTCCWGGRNRGLHCPLRHGLMPLCTTARPTGAEKSARCTAFP